MTDNININLEDIAKSCYFFENIDYQKVIEKIDALKEKYDEDKLVDIYNYMLSKSQQPEVLMHLIRCCDEYRKSSTLEHLINILLLKNFSYLNEDLKEKFLNVRIMCAKAIGNQKNTSVVNPLLYCMNNKDENYRVRLACADALGRIGDKYAVAPLIEVVKDEDEKSVYLKESAVSALALLGDSRALDPLIHILEAKQGIMDKFSFLKERVIEALDKLGYLSDHRVFKALKASLYDESTQVRIDTIEALMNSENPDSYDIIKDVLDNDNNDEVKKNALIALYNLKGRVILDEVISSSKYSETLKMNAADIINEYESENEND